MRDHENAAKRPCSAQTGWSKTTRTRIPKHFGKSTTPSAPQRMLRGIFLMSLPPLLCKEGNIAYPGIVHTLTDPHLQRRIPIRA